MKQSVVGIVRCGSRFLAGLRKPGGEIGSCWEFPGGKCEAGETHQQALIREYAEELSVQITVGAFIAQKKFKHERYEFELFAYEVFIQENQHMQLFEHSQVGWFSLDELYAHRLVPSDALFLPALRDFYHL